MQDYIFSFTLIFFQVPCHSFSEIFHFGHALDEERNWFRIKEEYMQCAYGVYQTPIHIENHQIEPIVMPALDFTGYNNFLVPPITLVNNGHTVKLTAGQYLEGSIYKRPSISGGLLGGQYLMENLHFHWGSDNGRGSEHVVNNVRYPMEMHVVHRNKNYSTWNEAVQHKDGVVVLAFFFRLRIRENRRYKAIIDKLLDITEDGKTATLDKSFALNTILPKNLDFFFTYEGSLTTPPCSEAVTWFIFPDSIPISFKQIQKFRLLSIPENFRSLQPLGQRRVFFRQQTRFIGTNFQEFSRENVSSRFFWLRV